MQFISENEVIESIRNEWGEISCYEWNSEKKIITVKLTQEAAKAAAERINGSRFRRVFKTPEVTWDYLIKREYRVGDFERKYYAPVRFCEGGIMVFEDEFERQTWENQR